MGDDGLREWQKPLTPEKIAILQRQFAALQAVEDARRAWWERVRAEFERTGR